MRKLSQSCLARLGEVHATPDLIENSPLATGVTVRMPINCKFGLETLVPNTADLRELIVGPSFVDGPLLNIRCAVPAHITCKTTLAILFDNKAGTGSGKTLPLDFNSPIALHEIIQAKSPSPANSAASTVARAKLLHDGDFTIVHKDIAIG